MIRELLIFLFIIIRVMLADHGTSETVVEQPVADQPIAHLMTFESPEGVIYISQHDIITYDWDTHTMTLKPGVVAGLQEKMVGNLLHGVPFNVVVQTEVIYKGDFTICFSSAIHEAHVIQLTSGDPVLKKDQVQIELGYPTKKFFTGQDQRSSRKVRRALREAKVLRLPRVKARTAKGA